MWIFGFRPGELFHLTWGSVDWTLGTTEHAGAVRIEEQKRTRLVGGKPWIPKNKRFRVVPFTPRGKEILERLKASMPDARPDDLVIPNRDGLPYIRLDNGPMKGGSAGIWNRLREASGVEGVAMRDLRHYFAVQNLMRGVPITVASAWMGHSSIELTVKRYGRWAHEAKEQWHWAALRSESVADCCAAAEADGGGSLTRSERAVVVIVVVIARDVPAHGKRPLLPKSLLELNRLSFSGALFSLSGIARRHLGGVGANARVRMAQVALEGLPGLPADEAIPVKKPVDVSHLLAVRKFLGTEL